MYKKMRLTNVLFSTFITSLLLLGACQVDIVLPKEKVGHVDTTLMVDVGGYNLYSETKGEGTTTIVFESGLNDDSTVWKDVYDRLSSNYQLVIYDRAGYASSQLPNNSIPRDINQLAKELKVVIDSMAQNDKVILVGHSLGGPIIRSFVNQFPNQVKAMLFVDPAHEGQYDANSIQAEEDYLLNEEIPDVAEFKHVRDEVTQLSENWAIQSSLPNLPYIPVTVLTAMSLVDGDEYYTAQERQEWFALHASLGEGVVDFKHISSTEVGHKIHIDNPTMVVNALIDLVN